MSRSWGRPWSGRRWNRSYLLCARRSPEHHPVGSSSPFHSSIEKGFGTFDDHGDLDIDAVVSGQAVVLQIGLDAYLGRDGNVPAEADLMS